MSHKYQKDFSLPNNFQETLRDFTREVLRSQPGNIYRFGYDYFMKLAKEMGESTPVVTAGNNASKVNEEEPEQEYKVVHTNNNDLHTLDESLNASSIKPNEDDYQNISSISIQDKPVSIKSQDKFEDNDVEEEGVDEDPEGGANSAFEGDMLQAIVQISDQELLNIIYNQLSSFGYENLPMDVIKDEIKKVFNYQLPEAIMLFVMAESEISEDGTIEIGQFSQQVTNVLKTIVGVESFMEEINVNEADVVHGLNKMELDEELKAIFERADEGQTGAISFAKFRRELLEADLDLSRREVNIVLSEAESDEHGQVLYEKSINSAHRLLFIANMFDDFCNENDLHF
ncbi:predicted protein [Naegleria gruberi]|uniref:Predicted protein n=1 Tax=Naegleria gruberi TaxID=5762 RepID=D2UYF7_NAEGR|nr:uncharacterized protein NAEGRDRAFT_61455 [Naegleria gruberi]EFC50467.1 predicted protein [Naegleria gruberi]|eukprot:XP_002683211.1 predicted protein [Naegleria gruberi strain NEG-M]